MIFSSRCTQWVVTLSICAAESSDKCYTHLIPCASRVRPSSLPTETANLTSQSAVTGHHSHAPKNRVGETSVSSRGLQLGLVLVNSMLVAGVLQAGAVAAVGAVDEVLSNTSVSKTQKHARTASSNRMMPAWNANVDSSHYWPSPHLYSQCGWTTRESRVGVRILCLPRSQCSCWSRNSPINLHVSNVRL